MRDVRYDSGHDHYLGFISTKEGIKVRSRVLPEEAYAIGAVAMGALGLVKMEWMRGVGAPDGGMPGYEVITLLTFTSKEAFESALAASGAEIVGDIASFTNVQPLMQINEPVSERSILS